MKRYSLLLATLAAATLSGSASAAYTPWVVVNQDLNYDGRFTQVPVPQFNPLRGVLTGVQIYVYQRPNILQQVENLSDHRAVFDSTLKARLNIRAYDGIALTRSFDNNIQSTKRYALNAFDGVRDFGGASGHSIMRPSDQGATFEIRDLTLLTKFTGVPVAISNPLLPDLLSGSTNLAIKGAVNLTIRGTQGEDFAFGTAATGQYTLKIRYEYL